MSDYGKQFNHVDDIFTRQKQLGWKVEEFLEYSMTAELLLTWTWGFCEYMPEPGSVNFF